MGSDDCCLAKAYAASDRDQNVQLMAAAPELFEALRFVMTCQESELQQAFIQAKAALDKATSNAV